MMNIDTDLSVRQPNPETMHDRQSRKSPVSPTLDSTRRSEVQYRSSYVHDEKRQIQLTESRLGPDEA